MKRNCQTCENLVLINPDNPNWSKCLKITKLSHFEMVKHLSMQEEGCPEYEPKEKNQP